MLIIYLMSNAVYVEDSHHWATDDAQSRWRGIQSARLPSYRNRHPDAGRFSNRQQNCLDNLMSTLPRAQSDPSRLITLHADREIPCAPYTAIRQSLNLSWCTTRISFQANANTAVAAQADFQSLSIALWLRDVSHILSTRERLVAFGDCACATCISTRRTDTTRSPRSRLPRSAMHVRTPADARHPQSVVS
ncbi:hypothetical protein OKW48_006570 [Paraburkholderia youngii]